MALIAIDYLRLIQLKETAVTIWPLVRCPKDLHHWL